MLKAAAGTLAFERSLSSTTNISVHWNLSDFLSPSQKSSQSTLSEKKMSWNMESTPDAPRCCSSGSTRCTDVVKVFFFSAHVYISEAFVTSSISEPYKTLCCQATWPRHASALSETRRIRRFLRLSLREQHWRLEIAILNPYFCKWRHSSSLKGHRSIKFYLVIMIYFFSPYGLSAHQGCQMSLSRGEEAGEIFFYGGGV